MKQLHLLSTVLHTGETAHGGPCPANHNAVRVIHVACISTLHMDVTQFIHLLVGPLSRFQLWDIRNKAAINIF